MTEETVSTKISSNGQIIIPKKWLEELGLNDNDLIELTKINDTIIIKTKCLSEKTENNSNFSTILPLFGILKDVSSSDAQKLLKELRMEEEKRLERFTREFNNRHQRVD